MVEDEKLLSKEELREAITEPLRQNIQQLIDSNDEIGGIKGLAKLAGLSRQAIYDLLNGKGMPSIETILSVSNAFGITVSQLIGQIPLEASIAAHGARQIPILLWQQCINASEIAPQKHVGNWNDWALTSIPLSPAAYALQVESKHLEPYFRFGSILFVDPEVEAADDDFVIVQSKACEKARIQKIVNEGNLWLHSLIDDHPPIELTSKKDGYKICGVILQSNAMYRDE